ncbi:hypothetical protein LCGC14_2093810 [marine sediment metagenome]|uniref:Uncharacterized protein n=1 Tax=marine sediment metagenome TaxID=412755 RepID=A0A0F9EZB0_9ZZZZ
MALNRSRFDRDYCAAGEKRMQELDPNQFRWRGERNQFGEAMCHLCDQYTKIKKDGFFVKHKSSKAGYKSGADNRPGEPPRERGRRQ